MGADLTRPNVSSAGGEVASPVTGQCSSFHTLSYEATHRALGLSVLGTVDRPVTAPKLAPLIERHRARAQSSEKEEGRTR